MPLCHCTASHYWRDTLCGTATRMQQCDELSACGQVKGKMMKKAQLEGADADGEESGSVNRAPSQAVPGDHGVPSSTLQYQR